MGNEQKSEITMERYISIEFTDPKNFSGIEVEIVDLQTGQSVVKGLIPHPQTSQEGQTLTNSALAPVSK